MPIQFFDDFDLEVEGTSPPANFVNGGGTAAPTNLEVDNVHSFSAPQSMWLNQAGSTDSWCRRNESFTTKKWSFRVYIPSLGKNYYFASQATGGNQDMNELMAQLVFRSNNNIEYYDGAYHDTGYNYTVGMHIVEIVHDVGNDQFDCWYDGVKILTNAPFRNGGKASVESIRYGVYNSNMWLDNIQIGEEDPGVVGSVIGVIKENIGSVIAVIGANVAAVDEVPSEAP